MFTNKSLSSLIFSPVWIFLVEWCSLLKFLKRQLLCKGIQFQTSFKPNFKLRKRSWMPFFFSWAFKYDQSKRRKSNTRNNYTLAKKSQRHDLAITERHAMLCIVYLRTLCVHCCPWCCNQIWLPQQPLVFVSPEEKAIAFSSSSFLAPFHALINGGIFEWLAQADMIRSMCLIM